MKTNTTVVEPVAGSAPKSLSLDREEIERRVHGVTNAERDQHDVDMIAYDRQLAAVARAHSRDMRDRGFVGHETPEGQSPHDRVTEMGYDLVGKAQSPAFCRACGGDLRVYSRPDHCPHCGDTVGSRAVSSVAVSENIAVTPAGVRVPEPGGTEIHETKGDVARGAVTQWLNSPGHRENLLDRRWEREGIGVALETDGQAVRVYVTQNCA